MLELRPPTRRGFSTKGPGYDNLFLHHPQRSLGELLAGTLQPGSINDRGQVIGYYDNGTTELGFLYSNGTWTTLSDPSAPTEEAYD